MVLARDLLGRILFYRTAEGLLAGRIVGQIDIDVVINSAALVLLKIGDCNLSVGDLQLSQGKRLAGVFF